jgi:arylformamidase
MKIYDISWPILNGMTAYKDRHVVDIRATKTFERDGVRESLITIGSHSGTHIDAPAHFLQEGKSWEEINPLACVGPARIIDMTHIDEVITAKDLEHIELPPYPIVLFKTKNSARSVTAPFDHRFVYLEESAARLLVERQVKGVGVDYLGIERAQPHHETHKTLLEQNIPIIEGLRLGHVPAGNYFLWCLPLCIPGIDGAPARAVLIEG